MLFEHVYINFVYVALICNLEFKNYVPTKSQYTNKYNIIITFWSLKFIDCTVYHMHIMA